MMPLYSSPCSPPFLMTFSFSCFGTGTSFGIFSWIGAGSEGFLADSLAGFLVDSAVVGFSVALGLGFSATGSFLAGAGFSVGLGVVVVVGFAAGFSVGFGVVVVDVVVGFGAGFSVGFGVVVVGFGVVVVVVVGFGVVVVVVVVVGFGVVVVVVVVVTGFLVVVVVGFGVVVVVVVVVFFGSSSKRTLWTRTFGPLGSFTRAR